MPNNYFKSWLVLPFLICLCSYTVVSAAGADNSKARARAEKALRAGDFERAEQLYREILARDDTDNEAIAIAGLAMVDYYENRLPASIAGLRHAVSLDPGEPDYIFSLGQAAARFERYKEAADAYERFLEIAPRTDADRRARIRGLIA